MEWMDGAGAEVWELDEGMEGVWVEAVEVEGSGLLGRGDRAEMLLEADADDDSMAGMEI